MAASAWAQSGGDAAPKEKTWVLGYLLTILGIALGLIVVCRPTVRKKDDEG